VWQVAGRDVMGPTDSPTDPDRPNHSGAVYARDGSTCGTRAGVVYFFIWIVLTKIAARLATQNIW